MSNCPNCGRPLETPLACSSCRSLLEPPDGASPFDVLGLVPAWAVDTAALRRKLVALSRLVHPDYFGNADAATRELAERNSSALNAAFELVNDDLSRADWLVRARGGPSESELRDMPRAFLADVLEWNETLEEARASQVDGPARARVDALESELGQRRAELLQALAEVLAPLPENGAPALAEARRAINAARYVDRALAEIQGLRLAHAGRR